ncbi:gal10 Bifunctional protein gal10 [Candida maltosa Xu316]|uniref:GAL10 bifunctional protein n=1 Tax=Candida maltosa (strain Xu316) TaxID=1245528 RepID=M3J4D0_CANMX|nr:GAL10 bifunctional protein [Candida maltosa Xu316]
MSDEYILVTGGAGYIGSHTVIELINHGYKVVIADNLSNSSYDAVARIEFIVKQHVPFYKVDIRNEKELNQVFSNHKISGVIHFAALKAVGESTKIPLEYYDNNVSGTIALLNVCKSNNVKTIVFSSSATVYGDVTRFGDNSMIPIPEHCPMDPTNPYGRTKFVIESILKDIYDSDELWKVAILRYFNPIGAHPSGLLGEDPLGIPNNLLPYLAQVAIGRREKLSIFGNDYNSHDGTPIRDYIHVVDLAKGHIAALAYLKNLQSKGLYREWNLGTGKGSTVFDVYHAFCRAVGKELPYEVVARRAGDVLDLTAKPDRANKELNWKAELTVDDACKDLWKWTTENPYGFHIDNYSWENFDGYNNRLHSFVNGPLKVNLANHGALIQKVLLDGVNMVKAYDNAADFKDKSNPFFGTTVGRFANRVAKGQFELNGKKYQLTQNEGNNNLHAGFNGFDKQDFLGPVVKHKDGKFLVDFLIVDKDGNDGFPGEVEAIVHYTIDESSVGIEYECRLLSGEATIVNMTNHSYFDVSDSANIDGTEVKLVTDQMMEVDAELIPTGKFVANEYVTDPIVLDEKKPFDNCFIVDDDNCGIDTRARPLKKVFEATHPKTNNKFTVETTEPAFQFYTGDGVNTKGFAKRCGFCVEPSRFIDAINHEKWANQVILKKGEVYGSKIKYGFTKK